MLEACRSRGSAGFGVGNGNDGLGELFSSACSLLSQPVISPGFSGACLWISVARTNRLAGKGSLVTAVSVGMGLALEFVAR